MHDLLIDPDRTSVRVVLTLERVVIKEAQRSFTYFHLYGYPTDLVIANRILPDDVGWKYFRGWHEAQQRYGPMVEQAFAPIPIRQAPYFDREVVGLDALREMGKALYGETDPTAQYYHGRPYTVSRDDGQFVLSVELPFATKEEIALSRHADEILIDVGSWRQPGPAPRPDRGADARRQVRRPCTQDPLRGPDAEQQWRWQQPWMSEGKPMSWRRGSASSSAARRAAACAGTASRPPSGR